MDWVGGIVGKLHYWVCTSVIGELHCRERTPRVVRPDGPSKLCRDRTHCQEGYDVATSDGREEHGGAGVEDAEAQRDLAGESDEPYDWAAISTYQTAWALGAYAGATP